MHTEDVRPLPPPILRHSRARRRALAVAPALLLGLVAAGCCCRSQKYRVPLEVIDEAQPPRPLPAPVPPTGGPTRLVMRHVHLRQADTFFLDVRHLLGVMHPTQAGGVPVFGDSRSFYVDVEQAEVAMSAASLTGVLNNVVFAYEGAPLDHLRVELTADHHLKQTGTLHKGKLALPFTLVAEVKPTPDGKLLLHPTKIEICDVNGKPLMDFLHLKMEKIVDLSKARGVVVHGDDMVLDPAAALPPPRMVGRVTAVRIEGDQLVQEIGRAPGVEPVAAPPPPPDREAANYIHLYGGVVRFGRLYMVGTNLELVDAHPEDPFEFYTTYFDNQLDAGYSRSQPDGSLVTYCPDFSRVGKTFQAKDRIGVARR